MNSVILVGGGGHARVLADSLILQENKILGFVDPKQKEMRVAGRWIPYLGTDKILLDKKLPQKAFLVNGVGSVGNPKIRKQIFERFKAAGYSFSAVIHPSAILARDVQRGEGVQVMAGAVVQAGTHLGNNCIINTRASVDHDCRIGDHVHIAPGAILCGGVKISEGSHVGCGAVIIQGVTVGRHLLIPANTLVKRPVAS